MTTLASSYKEVCFHGSQVHEHWSFSCSKTCLCQWSVCQSHLCHSHNWDHKTRRVFVISQPVKRKHLIESQSRWNRNSIFSMVKSPFARAVKQHRWHGGQNFFYFAVTRSSLWESRLLDVFGGFKVASFPGSHWQVAWEW